MKRKIICILLASFFIFNIGSTITSMAESEGTSDLTPMPLNDVHLEPIEGNEAELQLIEDEPSTTITTGTKGNCAVVIKQFAPPSLGECMRRTCEFAIGTLRNNDYINILYLNTPTNDDINNGILEFVKENIGDDDKLFIYIEGHGNVGYVQLNPFQVLYDYQLASVLDDVTPYISVCTVVMDSCHVGSFIDNLAGENRIIITATDSSGYSWGKTDGMSYFSGELFTSIGAGKNLKDAWMDADSFICDNREELYSQNPQLEDNGNGFSVGTYTNADILPKNDGFTISVSDYEGNLAGKSNDRLLKNIDIHVKLKILFCKILSVIPQLKEILLRICY